MLRDRKRLLPAAVARTLDGTAERVRRQRLGMSPRLIRIDLQDELFLQYERTLSAPATPAHYNSILGNRSFAAAVAKVATAAAAAE